MKMSNVFIGSIIVCTKDDIVTIHEGGGEYWDTRDVRYKVYKPNAILIKLGDNAYVDLETIQSWSEYRYLKNHKNNKILRRNNIILNRKSHGLGSLLIEDLHPYQNQNIKNNGISVKRLKKEIEIDNRF